MTTHTDPRVQELLDLAREERMTLPYPIDLMIWLEDRGYIVDVATGTVYNAIIATPTVHARAVAYLLGEVEGEIVVT